MACHGQTGGECCACASRNRLRNASSGRPHALLAEAAVCDTSRARTVLLRLTRQTRATQAAPRASARRGLRPLQLCAYRRRTHSTALSCSRLAPPPARTASCEIKLPHQIFAVCHFRGLLLFAAYRARCARCCARCTLATSRVRALAALAHFCAIRLQRPYHQRPSKAFTSRISYLTHFMPAPDTEGAPCLFTRLTRLHARYSPRRAMFFAR